MNRRNPENLVLKGTLLFTSTLIVMAAGIIAPALPLMQAHFAEVANVAFWVRLVLTLPALFIAATAPIAGYIVDRIGRKKVLMISTLLYGLSGAAGYLAPTLSLLRGCFGSAVACAAAALLAAPAGRTKIYWPTEPGSRDQRYWTALETPGAELDGYQDYKLEKIRKKIGGGSNII